MSNVVYQCNECEEPIREGEFYYALKGECYCERCVSRNINKAEKEINYLEEES
jgi:hypothetical protein